MKREKKRLRVESKTIVEESSMKWRVFLDISERERMFLIDNRACSPNSEFQILYSK